MIDRIMDALVLTVRQSPILLLGFAAGMLAMRENYLGVIRNLKAIIKEYERRA